MRHTITLTVEVESACESTIAIENALCACIAGQAHGFQEDESPEVEFNIISTESENASCDTDLARMPVVVQDVVRGQKL